jgi:predicted GH43/DUF377 family glycosyl hydrolase
MGGYMHAISKEDAVKMGAVARSYGLEVGDCSLPVELKEDWLVGYRTVGNQIANAFGSLDQDDLDLLA